MKIRQGFVSNSSSSSFIVSISENKKPCPTCGHVEKNIVDYFRSGEDTYVRAEGKSSVISYVSDWGYNKKFFDKIEKAIDSCGTDVALVSCNRSNEGLKELAREHLVWELD